MVKIEPVLLTETFDKKALEVASKNGWYAQEKFNGTRNIIHVIDGKIAAIRNRTNNPVLFCYPELKGINFPFKSAILDGEIIVEKEYYIDAETGKELTTEELKSYVIIPSERWYNEMSNMSKRTQ